MLNTSNTSGHARVGNMNLDETTEDGLAEMEELLRRAEVGRLALSDENKPYVIPVNFAYEDKKIIFHCALNGKKVDVLKKNPSCCFEVDKFMGEVSYHYDALCHLDYDSVLAFGKAYIENDEENKLHFFSLLHSKYKEFYRKPPSEGGLQFTKSYRTFSVAHCVVIDVEELTGRHERTLEYPDYEQARRSRKMWHIKL